MTKPATGAVLRHIGRMLEIGARAFVPDQSVFLFLALGIVAAGVSLGTPRAPAEKVQGKQAAAWSRFVQVAAAKDEREVGPRTDRHGDPLPARAIARLGTVRFRQGWFVMALAFSPDGKTLALAGGGQGLGLWDAATGKQIRQFPTREQNNQVAFSPDGKLLAAIRGSGAIWDIASGKKVRELRSAQALAFSPDGKQIALVEVAEKTIRLEDVASGAEARRLEGHASDVYRVAFSPDGQWLASAGEKTVRLWNVSTGKEVHRLTTHAKDKYRIITLVFAPDGKMLASGSDETIRLWDPVSGKELRRLHGKTPVRTLAFSRDGKTLAGGCDGTLRLWDRDTGKEIRSWKVTRGYTSLDFSADGKTLVFAGPFASGIRRLNVATGEELPDFGGHGGGVSSLAFAADAKTLYSTSYDRTARNWNLATGQDTTLFDGTADDSMLLRLAPNQKTLAAYARQAKLITLWGGAGKDASHRLKSPWLYALAFSPNSQVLAGGGKDALCFWQVSSGQEIGKCKGARDVGALAFSPNGRVLASASHFFSQVPSAESTLRLWDPATAKELKRFSYFRPLGTVAFAPDGKTLATGDGDGDFRLRLWDVASGGQIWSAAGHADGALAFSPDGRILASGGSGFGSDSSLHLWEAASGKEITRFKGHHSGVPSLAFAPDGRTLASGGGDSQILLWDITGRLLDGRGLKTHLSTKQLTESWKALAGADAGKAYEAIWSLVAAPAQAVAYLKQQLHADEAADPKRLFRLIGDLDSPAFTARSAAAAEIRKIGDPASPALRSAVRTTNSLESRRRMEKLLEEIAAAPVRLRTVRAIQVVEYIGTPDAHKLLEVLARGLAGTRQTTEAQSARQRLTE